MAKPPDIRRVRAAAGLTQQELAARLAVDAMTVSRWERGVSQPSRHHRLAIERFAAETSPPNGATVAEPGVAYAPASTPEDARIDELVRMVGSTRALRSLRRELLLSAPRPPRRFAVVPKTRLRELESMLAEQTDLVDRSTIGRAGRRRPR